MAATRFPRPGYPDAEYLFIPGDQWIQDSHAALPAIAAILLPNLTGTDAAIGNSLCGRDDDHPWPNRAGYWVGDQVVHELLDAEHELSDLMTWGPDRVAQAFRESSILAQCGTSGS